MVFLRTRTLIQEQVASTLEFGVEIGLLAPEVLAGGRDPQIDGDGFLAHVVILPNHL